MGAIDPYDPEVSRKNRKLALLLVAVIVIVLLAFLIRFTLAGLPEDMREWSRIQQREDARSGEDAPLNDGAVAPVDNGAEVVPVDNDGAAPMPAPSYESPESSEDQP
ncbi:MAG: hypothetical protein EA401_12030 [Planctomycetota bacterium]|nr:MAG: hypothetical protein EA401_12030 [Planctomycetota bacterium]